MSTLLKVKNTDVEYVIRNVTNTKIHFVKFENGQYTKSGYETISLITRLVHTYGIDNITLEN